MTSLPPILSLLLFTSFPTLARSPQTSTTTPASEKESATVAGHVLRLDTGEPLKKARVTLRSHPGEEFSVFTLTDEQGRFLFEDTPPGSYDLEVSRDGYVDANYGQKRIGAPGAILTLTSGQRMNDLVFKLAHTAAISGHVFDEDGEPIAKATVITYRASKRLGKEQEVGDAPELTNDLGEFRVFDLEPGRYYIAVNYWREDPFQQHSPAPNQKLNTGYLPSYYPNTADPAKAQAISVGPGDEIRPVDFFLRASRVVTLRGRVICEICGNSGRSGRVSLNPQGAGLAHALQGLNDIFRPKDGSFVLRNVPPGSYDLTASYTGSESSDWHLARRPLEVGNSDMDGVAITISHGVDISGHLIWEGSAPNEPGNLHVRLQPLIEDQPYFLEPAVKPDGTFQFKNVPEGSYRPVVHLYGPVMNFFLKSARYGSTAISDAGFTVQPGTDLSLELTMSSRVARLSGVVLDANSLPAAGATVVLIPDPPHRGVFEQYKSTTTDQNGKFSMSGLTPGDYKVFSWDAIDESEEAYDADWFDPEWLKLYETKGESVHLEESGQKSVNLALIETLSDSSAAN
jgi:5-hydroxyisourate hydrolase-like protein (transthyretin family)